MPPKEVKSLLEKKRVREVTLDTHKKMDECRLRHSASHDEIRDFEVDAPKKKRTPKQEGNAESVPGAAQGTFKNIASILGETDSQKTSTALRPPNSLPFFLPPHPTRHPCTLCNPFRAHRLVFVVYVRNEVKMTERNYVRNNRLRLSSNPQKIQNNLRQCIQIYFN